MAPESWFSIYFLLFFDVGSTFFTYRIFIYGILYLYTKKSGNICFQISPRGANQIWTGDRGVADLCLTTWLWRQMTPTGIEPVLPPWKGDVLTAWPWSRIIFIFLWKNSPSRARTYNNSVNSRVLYHWAIEENILLRKLFKRMLRILRKKLQS